MENKWYMCKNKKIIDLNRFKSFWIEQKSNDVFIILGIENSPKVNLFVMKMLKVILIIYI